MRPIDADKLWMDVVRSLVRCDDVLRIIDAQPTVEERPKGRWVWEHVENETGHILSSGYKCDQCGTYSKWKENYCCECGADMRGADDESTI